MNITNPKVAGQTDAHLQNLLALMPKKNPTEYLIRGTKTVPEWEGVKKHFQGIAPMNGSESIIGQISASADTWWCASFIERSIGTTGIVSDVFGSEHYDHAGGIQRLGDVLPVPLEKSGSDVVTVAFYDVTNANTTYMYEYGYRGKASGVAITNYCDSDHNEQAVMLVYEYDPKRFKIYRTAADAVTSRSWEHVGETNAIPDPARLDDQFQSFGLVTQTFNDTDTVYLLAFRENEAIVLCTMDTGSNYGHLTYVETYEGFDGSQWRYGVGLQICGPSKLRIFGCSEDPTGDTDDYSFPLYVWG
ncbi:MAG: hypothetical protein JO197_13725 [Acidobacteria bacterium]|nr:hypothetical protein [Acidobacteriota bacterium]MBV9477756.1 hypothetical protein [Acidobacteriota bacterium]